MRLQQLIPPLPQILVEALDAHGIRTDADILFSASPTDIFRKLPAGTIGLQPFHELLERVAAQAAAPAIRGDKFLQLARERREEQACTELQCGVPQLDRLLGSLAPPRVIEVSGDKGAGKTAFALQVVLRHLSTVYDVGALWIDTTGEFSSERIVDLLEAFPGSAKSTVLERLQVALAFDVEAAHQVLEDLRTSLSSDPPAQPTIRCVVIDSITPLIGPLLSAVSSQGHAIMTTFMRQLRTLAETFSLTFLVINSSTKCAPHNPDSNFFWTDRKAALGPSFTFLTDTTLWLSQAYFEPDGGGDTDEECTTHVAEIFRSRTTNVVFVQDSQRYFDG